MHAAWLIILFCTTHAQNAQELFLAANQRYANKDFESALKLYDQIPQKGAATWYNMGNCAYKIGNNLHALLYWNRAEKNGTESIIRDCAVNRAAIMHKLQQPFEHPSRLKFATPLVLQILFFCAFSVFLVIVRIFIRRKKIIALSLYGLFLCSVGFLTYAVYHQSHCNKALVMNDNVFIYAGPDSNYHQVAMIPAGSSVIILMQTKDWTKIDWHKQVGWIANNTIEVI